MSRVYAYDRRVPGTRWVTVAAVAAAVAAGASQAASPAEWLTFGNGVSREGAAPALPVATLKPAFYLPLEGRITSQILAADGRLYAATSAGRVYAFTPGGYVLWSRNLGQLAHPCPQLDGYGITGTGAIDAATHTLYVADAFGRLHALDLASGRDRAGWPVRIMDEPSRELAWGALLLADGNVYVPTGSYCDGGPMQGHVYSVGLTSHAVQSWTSVPDGVSGGGIWGWGGVAYSASRDSLFVAVGNAFVDGNETTGYGEHLVELSPQLTVRAASTTPEPVRGTDADLVGSPVVFTRPECGELAVAARKDGRLFGWKTASVDSGPIWDVQLEPYDETNPVIAQPVYDAQRNAVFVVTGAHVARVDIGADCDASVAWSRNLGTTTENGIPTLAGDTLWVALAGRWSLAAIDTATGAVRRRIPLSEPTFTPPAIVAGRLFVGSFSGGVHAFASTSEGAATSGLSATRDHASWPTKRLGWQSRANGVYATDDGGAHWLKIYPRSAISVVRATRRVGVIVTGAPVPACGCHARIFRTDDGGKTWAETRMLSTRILASGGRLFWINSAGTAILQVASPARSRVVLRASGGRFLNAVAIRGGVAALLTSRIDGQGWDTKPRLAVLRNGRVAAHILPAADGQVLVDTVTASWPTLVVRGTDFQTGAALTWRSTDGGVTWTLRRL